MIYSLKGTLLCIEDNYIVVECGGVGYKCLTSAYTQEAFKSNLDTTILVYTYMNVRQDAIDLFGFSEKDELSCFKLLTSVSGVGPKAALAILSQFSSEKVASIVTSDDSKSLTAVSGIGAKTAKRIVLELKDKLFSKNSSTNNSKFKNILPSSSNAQNAANALMSLGYSYQDVMPFISSLDSNLSTEDMIKMTLKSMAKGV